MLHTDGTIRRRQVGLCRHLSHFIKQPAEKSLLCHIQYMRELLDKHIIRYLLWVDTRDMAADGLTKGAVARDALHEIMAGDMIVRHTKEQ